MQVKGTHPADEPNTGSSAGVQNNPIPTPGVCGNTEEKNKATHPLNAWRLLCDAFSKGHYYSYLPLRVMFFLIRLTLSTMYKMHNQEAKREEGGGRERERQRAQILTFNPKHHSSGSSG